MTIVLLTLFGPSFSFPITYKARHCITFDDVRLTGKLEVRDAATVTAVLHSAVDSFVVTISNDGEPHKISALIGPSTLPTDTIDTLQYDSVRLLNDQRCIFETPNNMLVLGGGVPTSAPIGPPQSLLSITCAADFS